MAGSSWMGAVKPCLCLARQQGRSAVKPKSFLSEKASAFLISIKLLELSPDGDYNLPRNKQLEENMKKTVLAFVMIMALVLSLAACGNAPAAETEAPAAAPQSTETSGSAAEDGQNPVMNFVGVYSTEYSTEALVEAEGLENARITVTWAGSPWFHNQTVMSGPFDSETLTMTFANSTLTEYSYKSDGSVDEEKVSYTDATGRAVFDPENNTLTITEEFESGNIETVYTWGPSPDMKYVSDPEHYAPVTAMDKFQVETVVGFNVRSCYLSENWYAMADMIRYPITINGVELADADAFLGYMTDKTISESDRDAMLEEDLLDMFVNGQGICMGSGQVWLSDPNYMTGEEPVLEIIAISGIAERG